MRSGTEFSQFLRIFLPTFGNKLYRQNVGIPMDTNFGPLINDLFLFCYERECYGLSLL